MTHETKLYAGWWWYAGLLGLGLLLLLAGLGGIGRWLGLALLVGLLLAAYVANRRGYGYRRHLSAVLSPEGLTLLGHPAPPPDQEPDFFVSWMQITGMVLRPRPGYWQIWIETSLQPDVWLLVGEGLELAHEIVEIAGLDYDETRKQQVAMGYEHYWFRRNS